jgi:GR25 family glycosyltransferase involved in LPS biosynthesis
MIDIVYWIHLKRAVDRQIHMDNMFKNDFFKNKIIERFEAHDVLNENILDWFNINGEPLVLSSKKSSLFKHFEWIYNWIYANKIKKEYIERKKMYNDFTAIEKLTYCNKRLSKGEYACTLSHLETIRKFSNSPYNIAIIFEDDITFDYEIYWRTPIENIIQEAPNDWEIIQICYISNNHVFNQDYTVNENNNRFYDNLGDKEDAYSCAAYIINKKAAKKICKNIFKNGKYELDHTYHHVADFLLYHLFKTYVYKYPYFTYRSNNNSFLHPDHLSGHNRSKNYITECYKSLNRSLLIDLSSFKIFILLFYCSLFYNKNICYF